MQLIKVTFREGGQQYTYHTDHEGLAIGDRVVVPTAAEGETEGIATITALGSDYLGDTKPVLYKLRPGEDLGREKPTRTDGTGREY
jgi:hypothetical protein